MEQNLMPGEHNLSDTDYIDVRKYFSLFLSNWYWFAIGLFIAVTLAYSINRYSPKIFSVSATLLIKDDQMANLRNNVSSVIPGGDIFKSQQNLNNEMGILKSFSLNYRVMRELKDFHVVYTGVGRRGIAEKRLYKTCPFIVEYDSLDSEPKGVRVNIEVLSDERYRIKLNGDLNYESEKRFGERFSEYGFNFVLEPRFSAGSIFSPEGSNSYYFYFVDPAFLASDYRGKLSVVPIEKNASLVVLSVSGLVPLQEADYLNKLMSEYIVYGVDNKNLTADSTIKFIDDQLKIISDSLTAAEEKLEMFRSKNSLIDLTREELSIQNRLEKLENEKTGFELQYQYYTYLSEYLNSGDNSGTIISPSVMGINDQILIKLVNDLSSLQKEFEKIGFNLTSNQPAIIHSRQQIDEARMSLKENVRNSIASLMQLIDESEKKIATVEVEVNKLPSTERKLISIQRKFDLNNTVYTYLLEKRSESAIARASNVSDNRIIDRASGLSSLLLRPRTRINFILSVILGLIVPAILLILIDFFNNKVIDKRDIERKTKTPIIGFISHSSSKNEIPVIEKPGSSLAESFRSVRTAIKYFIRNNEVAVIAITSTISSEGKTFISINLATIIAMLGKKVLIVGLDLRKPRINNAFEFEKSPGMSNFLSGNCSYEEIIKATQIKNLFYAPSGPVPPNPAELIETPYMKLFMDRAKQEYDFIIIDTPPVAIVTDTLLLAPYVNVNLFIVRQRYTSQNTLEMIEQLRAKGELKNLAIIINDISLSGYYGYGMRYGYTHGYGYSYGYNYYNKGYYGKYGSKDNSNDYYTED